MVQVNHQDPFLEQFVEEVPQVAGNRRFPHAALLVG